MVKFATLPNKIAFALTALLLASSAGATEYLYGVEIGAGTTDNVGRTPTDEQSETISTYGLDFELHREGRRSDADVYVDLAYYDYQDNTFDSEVLGAAFVDLRGKILPDRFEWVLTDSFGQSSIDPFVASTPTNRENVNYLTTGPDFKVRVGSQGSLTMFGRYSASQYEESNFDDERKLAGISLARELSPQRSLSINGTSERIEFDDPTTGSSYDRQSAFLRYTLEGARTRISADAGYTQLHDYGSKNGSPLIEVEIGRDISDRSVLTMRAGVRSSDTASELLAFNPLAACSPSSSGQTSSPDPFETRHATLCWQIDAHRSSFSFWVTYEDDLYETRTQLDRNRTVLQASFGRLLTPRLEASLRGWLYRADYESIEQDDDENQLGLYVSWNVVGRLYFEASVESFERDSTNDLTDFEEMRAFLRFAWRDRLGAMEVR